MRHGKLAAQLFSQILSWSIDLELHVKWTTMRQVLANLKGSFAQREAS